MALRASYYGLKKRILEKVLGDYDASGVMTNKELTENKIGNGKIIANFVSTVTFKVKPNKAVLLLTNGGSNNRYGGIIYFYRLSDGSGLARTGVPTGMTISRSGDDVTVTVADETFHAVLVELN